MSDLFRAEWLKITRHVKPLSFLVWIYPVGALTGVAMLIVVALFGASPLGPATWTTEFAGPWKALTQFPQNIFIRLPFLAFTALLFAGEYEWETWKNIVPRNNRAALVLVKFASISLLLLVALTLTNLTWGSGRGLAAAIDGSGYGPPISVDTLRTFAADYLLEMGIALLSTLILAGIAALVALRTRSTIAGIFISLGISIVEPVSLFLLLLLASAFDAGWVLHLTRLTPTYNLDNLRSWLVEGRGGQVIPFSFFDNMEPVADGALFSAILVTLWVSALVGLTVYIFRRQDIA